MCVGADHQRRPRAIGLSGQVLGQVPAVWLAVDLESDPGGGGGADHPDPVGGDRLPPENQTSGRVTDHVHPRTFDGTQEPVGHLSGLLVVCRMN